MNKLFVVVGLLQVFGATAARADGSPLWPITKDHWTDTDEQGYSEFVQKIGQAGCNSIDSCLKNAANPYRLSDPVIPKILGDCSKLPYVLRAYYAWKNGLPFAYENAVSAVTQPGDPIGALTPDGSPDIRYSPKGNQVTHRRSITTPSEGKYPNAVSVLVDITENVNTAMYRINPAFDNVALFTDMYPAALTRDGIRPGTAIYDPSGHVAVVYQVADDGRVLYIDSHPDNSLTHGTYGEKFVRSSPNQGSGFKNFRPLQLVGAIADATGDLIGGTIVGTPDAKLANYSMEEYLGNQPSPDHDWRKGVFVFTDPAQPQGAPLILSYYDYVRHALAVGNLRYQPVLELGNMLDGLCQDLNDRASAVALAVTKGISVEAHPAALPNNIYGTSGDWEDYSSPSRDARIKTSFKEAHDRSAQFMELWEAKSPQIDYSGTDLKGDLLKVYEAKSQACVISYEATDHSVRQLTLHDISDRLFLLSFDPYHCTELRWGESSAHALASCPVDPVKEAWYVNEQRLRNQLDRTYDASMGYTLQQLAQLPSLPGSGVDAAPDVSLAKLLGGR